MVNHAHVGLSGPLTAEHVRQQKQLPRKPLLTCSSSRS